MIALLEVYAEEEVEPADAIGSRRSETATSFRRFLAARRDVSSRTKRARQSRFSRRASASVPRGASGRHNRRFV